MLSREEHAAYFLDAIFGVDPVSLEGDGKIIATNSEVSAALLKELTDSILVTLTPREEEVILMRFGMGRAGRYYTQMEVGQHLAVTRHRVRQIEYKALRKLRHPSRSRILKQFIGEYRRHLETAPTAPPEVVELIETIKALTPQLIEHLRSSADDLIKLDPNVAEHLVAELLRGNGFHDVRLVGTNSATSADVFAVTRLNPIGMELRIFVEVKRWRKRVGIGIINQVLGAMVGERPDHGWHAAMIVSAAGFARFQKWTPEQISLKGIELKDRDDLTKWLTDYKRSPGGLWLPR